MMTGPTKSVDVGVGVDVEAVERFRMIPKSLFTAAELAAALRYRDPSPSLAGTWCAKEAVVKALGRWGPVRVRNVEILHDACGRPVARVRSAPNGWTGHIDISIAHSAGVAMAVAVAVPGTAIQSAGVEGLG